MIDSTFGFPVADGMARHNEAVALSESMRAADYGAAEQAYAGDSGKHVTYQEALRVADIAHMRRVVASADANGVSVPNTREALSQLGVTL
jgi:hypothetical protein